MINSKHCLLKSLPLRFPPSRLWLLIHANMNRNVQNEIMNDYEFAIFVIFRNHASILKKWGWFIISSYILYICLVVVIEF